MCPGLLGCTWHVGRHGGREELAVTVFSLPGLLASALIAGLSGLGWRIRDAGGAPGERIVVAVEGDGMSAVSELGLQPAARLVLVGGLGCLAMLADAAVALQASAAVNADLPYAEVLRRADAALRAEPASSAERQRLHARLRARLTEADRFELLTNREAAVLADLVRGLSAADIAGRRPVALATVRSQIAAILRKLEVPSQAAAVALACRSCGDRRILEALRFHQNYG